MGRLRKVSASIGDKAFLKESMLVLPLAMERVPLFPNKMKGEDSQKGDNRLRSSIMLSHP